MLKERAKLVDRSLRLFDMAMLGAAFPIAYFLRDRWAVQPTGGLFPIATYWPFLAASLLVWQLASWTANLYRAYRTLSILHEVLRLARTFVVLAVVIAAGQFALKQHELSRLFFGIYYATAFGLLVANRVVVRLLARAARRRGYNTRSFAVVGSGEMADVMVQTIAAHREWGYVFAGYILDEGAAPPHGAHVLGHLDDMGRILEDHVVDEVVFAVARERLEAVEEAALLCEEQGVGVKVLLNLFPNRISKLAVEEVDGIPVLAFSSTPGDAGALAGKRLFDLAVSAVVLALGAPLWLALALGVKLDSRGPVLFRQRRVGQNGREFWLYKFRSMYADAEARRAELEHRNEMDGPAFKIADDPRVTRLGRFLRKTSLDEVPQFWNVLKGEMSVVGPRPPLPSEVKRYQRWQRRRLSVRPGITCTWQVSGRNELDFAQWMELDLRYIDNWSLWRDLEIVLRTIPAVLLGRGAR
jgi:exopolysaccharide biosynthesis polyprenyl glycosylphosphotransferase